MNYVFMLLLSLSVAGASAQSGITISGSIQDDNGNGIDLAQVALMNRVDSSFTKAAYTDLDGSFELTNVLEGEYFFQARMLGFDMKEVLITVGTTNMQLDPMTLKPAANQIETATVEASVPFVERLVDRIVINPEALVSSAGSDALDIIEQAPGIQINNDGTLLLKGRAGAAVYINDKPSYLSGNELENYLRSLPAGSIKKIEIMENPPAHYDAAGSAGIINIELKRNTLKGMFGNLSLGFRKGQYNNSHNSLNINFNKNKLSLYANASGGFYENFQDLNINRFYITDEGIPESSFRQNSYIARSGEYLNLRFGADYFISDKTSFGASFATNTSPSENNTFNTSLIAQPDGQITQRVVADNHEDDSFENQLYSVYFAHDIDTLGQKISLDMDYVQYESGSGQEFENSLYNESDSLFFSDQIHGDIPSIISIYAAKADYSKPLGEKSNFEAGVKSAFTETDNEAIYSTTVDGVTEPDFGLSNQFLYDEWIHAAYLNFNTSFEKVDVQVGLRGEATTLEGHQLGNEEQPDSSFTRSYQNLFPTVYTTFRVDSAQKHILAFSYSRRINRPYFMSLNPFISPLDKFTFYSGNPNLLPTFSNNYSFTYTWNHMLNASISYSQTADGINETLEIRDGIYYSRPGNIADNTSFTFSLDGSIPFSDWYSLNFYAAHTYQTFDGPLYDTQLSSSGAYQYAQMTNSFSLGNGLKVQLQANYRSDMVYSQLILKSTGGISAGVQKSIFDGKGNIKVNVSDILYTQRGSGIINNLTLTDADWNSLRDTRRVSLGFSWNFGTATGKKKHQSSGSESEQQRVR
jgi:hypothetical protein